jgi:hypothetical protein
VDTSSNESTESNQACDTTQSGGACGSPSGGPTDNPIATYYGSGAYTWTDSITWECVYNVDDYSGTDMEKFNAAQSDAVANGGGVVYFPSGTYSFSDYMELQSGVVIRGAGPSQTTFVFPDMAHKGVFNNGANDSNLGIVGVYLDAGAVMLWPNLVTTGTSPADGGNLQTYWWYATDINGMGTNKVVFNCKIQNVTLNIPRPADGSGWCNGNEWPWRFSTAIACYTDGNCLVANNDLPQTNDSKNVSVTFDVNTGCDAWSGTAPYPFDNRYGIDVNRVLLGGVIGSYAGAGLIPSTFGGLTPSNFPWHFRQGITIRDNWVFQEGRVGIIWGGGGDGSTRGSGAEIRNNHVEVASGSTLYSVDGCKCAGGQSTNENRGFDQGGYGSYIVNNTGTINRQTAYNTGYLSTDGEGVLHQEANNSQGRRDIWDNNDLRGGNSGYMAYYKLNSVYDSTITNNTVNSGEMIGGVSIGSTSGIQCSGNSPSCTGL